MKFIQWERKDNILTIKFLGITVFKQVYDYKTMQRTRKYFFNIVMSKKDRNLYDTESIESINFLGIPILKINNNYPITKYYIFNKLVKTDSYIDKFKKKYLKYIDKQYDDVYILRANSGEAILILTYMIDAILKKNQSKKPLLVATQKYHIDLINMTCPEIPHIYINIKEWLSLNLDSFKIDNQKFFVILPNKHFAENLYCIKNNIENKNHFFENMLNSLSLKHEELVNREIILHKEVENSVLQKAKKINLKLDNFVLIAPEAQSFKSLDDKFWINIIEKYKKSGLDIFVNTVKPFLHDKNIEFKTCYLTFEEIFVLAKYAKKIIGLRSGLLDILMFTKTPMHIYYTKALVLFENIDASQLNLKEGFSLKKIPMVNKNIINEEIYDC